MNYVKPDIFLKGSALNAIQSLVKGFHLFPDSIWPFQDIYLTNGAYEADE